jgi:itaconate CoA-transferase
MGALSGLLVVSLEQAVAAPWCSSRLADAGARVIKIERAEGDFARGYDHVAHGESAYFVWINRGKESIVLDIKTPGDADLLARMIAKADIFIQNLAPGAAERAGFGSAALRARHARLITCDISGYGEEGPCRDMKAYDLLMQCETGLAAITGSAEGPGRVGVSVCDIAAGMYAHAAILEALFARERTGKGKGIQVSLFDSMADWMTVPLLHQIYGGRAPARVGLNHPSIAPYGAYPTGSGKDVVLSIQNEREWASFCKDTLLRPDLAQDPRFDSNTKRVANRPALDREIEAVFLALDHAQVVERLKAGKVAYGSVNQVADLAKHPHLRAASLETPTGPVEIVESPVHIAGERRSYGPIPAIGQHSLAIRREFAGD